MFSKREEGFRSEERSMFIECFPHYAHSIDKLDLYVELLKFWQKTTNLIAPNSLAHIWSRHIIDSAQIAQILPHPQKWVDIGSGGGFPGLVIAMVSPTGSGLQVHLVESDKKKCAFLREVSRETSSPAVVHNARVEDISKSLAKNTDALSARALAPLGKLLNLSNPFLDAGALGIFMKGKLANDELTSYACNDSLLFEKRESITDKQASIILVKKSNI